MWVTLSESNSGKLYRCKVTDGSGNVAYSEPGEIRTDSVAVTKQPEDYTGAYGTRATFTIEAHGTGLSYQWQVSANDGESWSDSTAGGYDTASMWINIGENSPGNLYRCKVTKGSKTVYSEPAEVKAPQVKWTYTYNADGLRTERTDGYNTYRYIYNGDKLSQMTVGDKTLRFAYSASGAPLYVHWNTSRYFYVTNQQGDVTAIVSLSGKPLVEYTYDAWGNVLTITGERADDLGKYNPLRYRGYVYDRESSLYYLQSRYYGPQVGRFLNADALASTGQGLLGNNLFAYCNNNPVSATDHTGNVPVAVGIGVAIAVVAAGALATHAVAKGASKLLGNAISSGLAKGRESIPRTAIAIAANQAAEVYEYSRSIAKALAKTSERIPHVHHIVPAGNFSNRSQGTVDKINQMHEKLGSVGINRFTDPMNLVLVSAKTHARLHTDAYIDHVHSYIMSAEKTKQDVYAALFYLRLEIAAWDINAVGY